MARYITNIAKSQYYFDNNLNWTAVQCEMQKNNLLLPIVSICTAASSLLLHRHRNCRTKIKLCLAKTLLYFYLTDWFLVDRDK